MIDDEHLLGLHLIKFSILEAIDTMCKENGPSGV